jgi:hypothetical protein
MKNIKKNQEVCVTYNTYPEHKGCKFVAAFYSIGAAAIIAMLLISTM